MPDRNITCLDCKKEFVFTEGEQEFYKTKDLSDPKRCKPCRKVRREAREGGNRQGPRP